MKLTALQSRFLLMDFSASVRVEADPDNTLGFCPVFVVHRIPGHSSEIKIANLNDRYGSCQAFACHTLHMMASLL
jgi:hypothetical protein